jgi:orotidine-5'-phosphate decarboxylase
MLAAASPVFVALDLKDEARALDLSRRLAPHIGGVKLGLEFFCACGPRGVERLRDGATVPLFLDLKLHDIPATVAGAVEALAPLAPAFLTLHASGGPAMMQAAVAANAEAAHRLGLAQRPRLLAVTALTSLDDDDLVAIGQIGPTLHQVRRLAALAARHGMDGVVCSPWEAATLRAELPPSMILMTPGVRPAGAAAGDQKRAMTPKAALAAGATHLVIGRPIVGDPDPAAAAARINADLRAP